MRRLGGACIYVRPARALKRALGLKFNLRGLGILNLSGSGLWRSDLVYAPRPSRIRARTIAAEIKFCAAGAVMRRYEILTHLNKTVARSHAALDRKV